MSDDFTKTDKFVIELLECLVVRLSECLKGYNGYIPTISVFVDLLEVLKNILSGCVRVGGS